MRRLSGGGLAKVCTGVAAGNGIVRIDDTFADPAPNGTGGAITGVIPGGGRSPPVP